MSKPIKASLLFFFSSSVLIITACGPQATSPAEFVPGEGANDLQSTNQHKDGTDAAPVQVGNDCAAGFCKLPKAPDTKTIVQLPDQVEVQPAKIINTSEKHVSTDVVDYHITRHVWQPVEIRHTVYEHIHLFLHDL